MFLIARMKAFLDGIGTFCAKRNVEKRFLSFSGNIPLKAIVSLTFCLHCVQTRKISTKLRKKSCGSKLWCIGLWKKNVLGQKKHKTHQ